jgi:hypothetical protein
LNPYFDRLIRQSGIQVGESPATAPSPSPSPSLSSSPDGMHGPSAVGSELGANSGWESFTLHEEVVDASAPTPPSPPGIPSVKPAQTPSRPSENRFELLPTHIAPSPNPNITDTVLSDSMAAVSGIKGSPSTDAVPSERHPAEGVPPKDGSEGTSLSSAPSGAQDLTPAANGVPPEVLESVRRWIASVTSPEPVPVPANEPHLNPPASGPESPPLPPTDAGPLANPDPLPIGGVADRLITMAEEVLASPEKTVPVPPQATPRTVPQPAMPEPVHVSIGSILVRLDAPPAAPVPLSPPPRASSPSPTPSAASTSGGGGSRRLRRHYLVPH